MVAAATQTDVLSAQFIDRSDVAEPRECERIGQIQPIGDLMSQLLARYLPAEDVWQQRSRMALKTVSAAAG